MKPLIKTPRISF